MTFGALGQRWFVCQLNDWRLIGGSERCGLSKGCCLASADGTVGTSRKDLVFKLQEFICIITWNRSWDLIVVWRAQHCSSVQKLGEVFMKFLFFNLLAILSLSSVNSFAAAEDHLDCVSKDSGFHVQLDTQNCNGFEFKSYDSGNGNPCSNMGEFKVRMSADGQAVKGRIQIISVQAGTRYTFIEPLMDGENCKLQYWNLGLQVQSVVSVGGKPQFMDLQCSQVTHPPEGSVVCDMEALEKHSMD